MWLLRTSSNLSYLRQKINKKTHFSLYFLNVFPHLFNITLTHHFICLFAQKNKNSARTYRLAEFISQKNYAAFFNLTSGSCGRANRGTNLSRPVKVRINREPTAIYAMKLNFRKSMLVISTSGYTPEAIPT